MTGACTPLIYVVHHAVSGSSSGLDELILRVRRLWRSLDRLVLICALDINASLLRER